MRGSPANQTHRLLRRDRPHRRGGLGQVYQATNTKLNRQVALKILPEAFAADPDRLRGFSERRRCSPVWLVRQGSPR